MKPSELSKSHGLALQQVSAASGVSVKTLSNWHKNKPDLFKVVVLGVKYKYLLENTINEK